MIINEESRGHILLRRAKQLAEASDIQWAENKAPLPPWARERVASMEDGSLVMAKLVQPVRAQEDELSDATSRDGASSVLICWEAPCDETDILACAQFVSVLAQVVRATLSAQDADELRFWIVGPPGSKENRTWQALREDLARDTYTCAKEMWLPPTAYGESEESASEFLEGSFLARPWLADGEKEAAASKLDDLGSMLRGKGKSAEARLHDILTGVQVQEGEPPGEEGAELSAAVQTLLGSIDDWVKGEEYSKLEPV